MEPPAQISQNLARGPIYISPINETTNERSLAFPTLGALLLLLRVPWSGLSHATISAIISPC